MVAAAPAAVAAAGPRSVSSASAERQSCPRLDALPSRDLPGGLRIAEAHTRAARLRGLAKLDELPEHLALHIPRCRSVHTFTMRFALDLIWLDGAGERRAHRPERPTPAPEDVPARAVGDRDARRLRGRVRGRPRGPSPLAPASPETPAPAHGAATVRIAAIASTPASASADTPASTSTAPAIRAAGTRSRPTSAAPTVAITTLVSRTAATGAASARPSASSTRM